MNKIVNDILKEEIFYEKLENGLSIYYMPKKGFTKKYAILATDYGSNDLEFVLAGENDKIRLNEGIAHFLEHKMFEQPDGSNAFEKFSKWGASANAFTNFTMTAYLFSTTENFYESLEHLINYVQSPYFTDENVDKEKGIIEQEIKMYNDDPDWNVYFNTLKALYVNYPVRIDIAGTVDSINKITKEELYKCYNTFYNPGNMALFVVGDLDFGKIMESISNINDNSIISLTNKVEKIYPKEPSYVNKKEVVVEFPVSIPMFNIAFKDNNVGMKGNELLRKEIITEILIDIMFKKGSMLYENLYMSGLINENFGSGFSSQVNYGFTIISGESKDPKKVKEIILKYIDKYKTEGISEDDFNRIKKKKIGNFLKCFDSVGFIANNFLAYKFKDINLLDYLEVIKDVKFEEVIDRLNSHLNEESCVISIVNPIK